MRTTEEMSEVGKSNKGKQRSRKSIEASYVVGTFTRADIEDVLPDVATKIYTRNRDIHGLCYFVSG